MDKRKVTQERRRLEALLADVPQRDALAAVIDNMAWQRVKLDEAMEQMQDASVICEYNNGGGQTGTRENPLFKSYLNLWRGYLAGFEKLASYLPKETQEEVTGPVDVLAKVRAMKKGAV